MRDVTIFESVSVLAAPHDQIFFFVQCLYPMRRYRLDQCLFSNA